MKFLKTAWNMLDKSTKGMLLSVLMVFVSVPLGFINNWVPTICLCLSVCNICYRMWVDMLKEEWEEFKLNVREKMNKEE